jgi:hypothetical protein
MDIRLAHARFAEGLGAGSASSRERERPFRKNVRHTRRQLGRLTVWPATVTLLAYLSIDGGA